MSEANHLLTEALQSQSDEAMRNPEAPKTWRFLDVISRILHPSVVFEAGTEDEISAHWQQGGNFALLMTHFRRIGPGHLGSAVVEHEVLGFLPGTTGVMYKRGLLKIPILRDVIYELGGGSVERSTEHLGETEDEKNRRQAGNHGAVITGAQTLAAGDNWLMYPEGATRVKVIKPNGKVKRVNRDPGVLLPIRDGVADMLGLLTPEQRHNLRLVGIAEHFGPRLLRSFRPTIAFAKPEMPVEGSHQDWLDQTHAIL